MCAVVSNAFELIQNEISQKRITLQNLDDRLFPTDREDHPKPNALIEISGNNGSGKTHLLQYIMSLCVIPADFGGKQSRVIFIDLKHKFSPEKFFDQIVGIIKEKAQGQQTKKDSIDRELSAGELTQIALNCLKSVIVLYSFSPDNLALAMDDVENILMEDKNGEIIFLALDGLDSFYWIENQERKIRMRTHYALLTDRLRAICNSNNINCSYTIDSNYLQSKIIASAKATSPFSDYRLVLDWKPGTERTLNGHNFVINKNGIQFI